MKNGMKKRSLILGLACGLANPLHLRAAPPARPQPNILFILSDDHAHINGFVDNDNTGYNMQNAQETADGVRPGNG